jgi:hypothetical protein
MNEGDNTLDNSHTTDDIVIDPNGIVWMRAERSGTSAGRVYTITYQAVDDFNNITVDSATVVVQHDMR